MRTFANWLAPHGIRVNCVNPSGVTPDKLRRPAGPDHGIRGAPAHEDVDAAAGEDPAVSAAQRDGDGRRPYATADAGDGGPAVLVETTRSLV